MSGSPAPAEAPGPDASVEAPGALEYLRWYLGPYAIGAVLLAVVDVGLLAVLGGPDGVSLSYLQRCVSPLVTAIAGPFLAALLPAAIVLRLTRRDTRRAWLRQRAMAVGGAGGALVGVLETSQVVVAIGTVEASTPVLVLVHAAAGALVGWAVFRLAGRRRTLVDYHLVVLATALAVGLHLVWSRYLQPVLAGSAC